MISKSVRNWWLAVGGAAVGFGSVAWLGQLLCVSFGWLGFLIFVGVLSAAVGVCLWYVDQLR